MCRWVVYSGQPILLADLVSRPSNSIINQSNHHDPYLPGIHGSPEEVLARNHRVNGDGFGVAWYSGVPSDTPCVFTSTKPSWNDLNLHRLAQHITSPLIFAHVRAASPGSLIVESNCHPFQFGRMLWMHNGGVALFQKIKYSILNTIAETTAHMIQGTTDSEHAGALFVHYLPDHDPNKEHSVEVLKTALLTTMNHLLRLIREAQSKYHITECCASSLNFAVTDGRIVLATRYRSCHQEPPSLYYSELYKFRVEVANPLGAQRSSSAHAVSAGVHATYHNHNAQHAQPPPRYEMTWKSSSAKAHKSAKVEAVIISSEPLTTRPENWQLVPPNHLLIVSHTHQTAIEKIELEDEIPQEYITAYSEPSTPRDAAAKIASEHDSPNDTAVAVPPTESSVNAPVETPERHPKRKVHKMRSQSQNINSMRYKDGKTTSEGSPEACTHMSFATLRQCVSMPCFRIKGLSGSPSRSEIPSIADVGLPLPTPPRHIKRQASAIVGVRVEVSIHWAVLVLCIINVLVWLALVAFRMPGPAEFQTM